MNLRLKTIKLLEENIGDMLLGICLDNNIFGFDTKSKGNKNKDKQMRLHQTKMLYTAKEASNRMKRQRAYWEKRITKHTSDKRVISKIYKKLIQLNSK